MKISMHAVALGAFAPMLESLAAIIDKAAASPAAATDLVNASLAPDMFTLAQQVQQACYYARDGVGRLSGLGPAEMGQAEGALAGLKAQIMAAAEAVRAVPADAFERAEMRDCSIPLSDDLVIEMDGLRFLNAWALPHFYFHVVTAYDILRHSGVEIGKMDYLSQVGGFIRPARA